MIIGIGTDILNLDRLKKVIDKYDQKFIDRIYGKNEIKISSLEEIFIDTENSL